MYGSKERVGLAHKASGRSSPSWRAWSSICRPLTWRVVCLQGRRSTGHVTTTCFTPKATSSLHPSASPLPFTFTLHLHPSPSPSTFTYSYSPSYLFIHHFLYLIFSLVSLKYILSYLPSLIFTVIVFPSLINFLIHSISFISIIFDFVYPYIFFISSSSFIPSCSFLYISLLSFFFLSLSLSFSTFLCVYLYCPSSHPSHITCLFFTHQ